MNFKLFVLTAATGFIVMQQEKTRALDGARKFLLKTIVFDVMYSKCVVMSLLKK